jgi:hypothetical protein
MRVVMPALRVDGRRCKMLPNREIVLSAGQHEIEILVPGRPRIAKKVDVVVGKIVDLPLDEKE